MATIKYWNGTAWELAIVGKQGPAGATGNVVSGFNAQTGTSYTLALSDKNKWVTANNASAITITVPPSVFSANDVITVQQIGTGQVTFSAGAGVTITSTGATATSPKTRARYSGAMVVCTASNTFTIVGDIS